MAISMLLPIFQSASAKIVQLQSTIASGAREVEVALPTRDTILFRLKFNACMLAKPFNYCLSFSTAFLHLLSLIFLPLSESFSV